MFFFDPSCLWVWLVVADGGHAGAQQLGGPTTLWPGRGSIPNANVKHCWYGTMTTASHSAVLGCSLMFTRGFDHLKDP